MEQRIQHKLITITWKTLHGLGPKYLSDLLKIKQTGRTLRSNKALVLEVPKTTNKNGGDRAFEKAAPFLWNKLPAELRNIQTLDSFKSKLKTHLFKDAYGNT